MCNLFILKERDLTLSVEESRISIWYVVQTIYNNKICNIAWRQIPIISYYI